MLHLSHQQLQEILTSRPVSHAGALGYDLYHSAFESRFNEPECTGWTKSIQLRTGITLLQTEITFLQDTAVEMISTTPQVGFAFVLEGDTIAHVETQLGGQSNHAAMHMSKQNAYVYANAASKGFQNFGAYKRFQALYVHFSYDSFKDLLGTSLSDLPQELHDALQLEGHAYLYISAMAPSVVSLCHALFKNPFTGKSREFYTEAKVFELIAYQLDGLAKADTTGLLPQLTKAEADKIIYCYQQLEQRLADPPSLIELAKATGLSVYGLKNGFKTLYGDTPFRVLTELRMHKAKDLLEKEQLHVSEAALAVGYNSLGTFSNTFFERFGYRPSAHKKRTGG